MDGKPLLARHKARATRDRPALQHAVHLQPEVVVKPAGCMLLDDEAVSPGLDLSALRLGRSLEIALLVIGLECHGQLAFLCGARVFGLRADLLSAVVFFFVPEPEPAL